MNSGAFTSSAIALSFIWVDGGSRRGGHASCERSAANYRGLAAPPRIERGCRHSEMAVRLASPEVGEGASRGSYSAAPCF